MSLTTKPDFPGSPGIPASPFSPFSPLKSLSACHTHTHTHIQELRGSFLTAKCWQYLWEEMWKWDETHSDFGSQCVAYDRTDQTLMNTCDLTMTRMKSKLQVLSCDVMCTLIRTYSMAMAILEDPPPLSPLWLQTTSRQRPLQARKTQRLKTANTRYKIIHISY